MEQAVGLGTLCARQCPLSGAVTLYPLQGIRTRLGRMAAVAP